MSNATERTYGVDVTNEFRPWQLVWVREHAAHTTLGEVGYVGQVLSRETPDNTYMVRRVPGHPGTLVELPSRCLTAIPTTHIRDRYHSVSYAIVSGRGSFPVDMLRYDNCCPVNFDIVDTDRGPRAVMKPGAGTDVMLVAKAFSGGAAQWTRERWSSFLWSLSETHTQSLRDGG